MGRLCNQTGMVGTEKSKGWGPTTENETQRKKRESLVQACQGSIDRKGKEGGGSLGVGTFAKDTRSCAGGFKETIFGQTSVNRRTSLVGDR